MDFVYFLFVASIALILAGFMAMALTRLYVSFILVLVNFSIFFMIFIADFVYGGPTSTYYLHAVNSGYMGFRPSYLFSGEIAPAATIFWHMFAHGSWLHLLMNSFALIIFGFGLETRVRRRGLLLCFFAGGIGGSLFTTAMAYLAPESLTTYPDTYSVGASGGLFGVLGTYFVLYPNDRPFSSSRTRGILSVWLIVLLYFSIESFWMFSGFETGIGHGAHIGGLMAGILMAPVVRRFIPPSEDVPKEMAEGSLEELRAMAGEEGLEDLYRKIEEEDIPDVRQAWVEQLIKKSRCPRCGRGLRAKGGVASCDCGWRLRY